MPMGNIQLATPLLPTSPPVYFALATASSCTATNYASTWYFQITAYKDNLEKGRGASTMKPTDLHHELQTIFAWKGNMSPNPPLDYKWVSMAIGKYSCT